MNIIKKIIWRIKILVLSLRWIPKFNLGDTVIYQGRKFQLIQGVAAPIWDLQAERYGSVIAVHESQFKKERSLKNYWHSFTFGYRFYMRSWYSIWVHKGIEPWMRGCNIWAGGKPL